MAAKLTFEAKMQGMEQVLDLLKRAEERMNDFGRVGSYALEGVDKRLKEFEQSLETINKSQNGLGGVFSKFDEANRKSSEFLGKSYRGIIDAMKQEVKAFENEADRITNKIKESEQALEQFKTRRSAMREQDYQEGLSSHNKELQALQGQQAAVISSKTQLERELFFKQPVNQGVHDFASKFGLGQYATVGGAIQVAGATPLAIAQVLSMAGNYGVQQMYTKEASGFLADARLNRSQAAQAMQGNITTSMVRRFGGGIEDPSMNSWSAYARDAGTYLMENPFVRGIGTGVGTFAALTGSTLGFGAPVGIGAGIVAGGAAFASAPNRSWAEIRASQRGRARAIDKETYENLYDPAGQGLIREGRELEGYQRMYGISGAHNLEMQYAYAGVSADRANPFLNQMQALGMRPTAFGFRDQTNAVKEMYRASMSDPVRMAILRGVALNGGTLGGGVMNTLGLDAGAGLTRAGDIQARSNLNEYAAGLASQRGFGSNDLGTAGAPVAANVAANAPGFNKVEGVQQGIANYEAQTKLMQGGSSAMDTIMIQKLRGLGVTSAIAIDAFIKLDPRLASTQAKIAAYTGKDPKTVAEAITGAFKTYDTMYTSVIGKDEVEKFKRTTGVDLQTLQQSGVRAGENTAGGGATFSAGLESSATGGRGNGATVSLGAQSLTDKTDNANAAVQATIDSTLREILAGTGTKVTDAITKSILDGFLTTAKEVQKVGDRIQQRNAEDGGPPGTGSKPTSAPFQGTKQQKMSRGQQG